MPRTSVGRTRRSSRRRISADSLSPAHRLASVASANCDSASVIAPRLDLEPAVPANGGGLELLRLYLREQFEVVERDEQRRRPHLAEGELGTEEVALLDGAGEPSVCRSLACLGTLHLRAGRQARIYKA